MAQTREERNAWQREYGKQPHIKAKTKEYDRLRRATPEARAKEAARCAVYNSRPEIKEVARKRKLAYRGTTRGKVMQALSTSRNLARSNGFAPCSASIVELVNSFSNVCKVCQTTVDDRTRIHMDHCHTTGNFRGWLCSKCNMAIGLMLDSPANLRAAADYIEASG